MVELLDKIEQALKDAIKSRNEDKRNALRMLLTAIKNKEKELRRQPTEPEIRQLIAGAIKQRKDSIEQFVRGGRTDLAEKENKEMEILQSFLPQPLEPEALTALIVEAIRETGAASLKDMGKVMKVLMPRVAGRVDGKTVQEMVRAHLGGS
ncbi:MAG: GatB/YqeY domain-containing protein [Desulfosoma sp.]|uniref:GatB/YqeY domain-containing protein n=1 Tax=Desulfosoma sp. TaxID=2603217 RepID=UPI004049D7C2